MTTQTPYDCADLTMFLPYPEHFAGLMASMPADVGPPIRSIAILSQPSKVNSAF